MGRLWGYILGRFGESFFSIFSILFLITSLVFIVMISNMTASVKIGVGELLTLFLLTIPQVLFISLSISFFLAALSAYNQLSRTQELIGLVAGGIPPLKILAPVGGVGMGVTLLNLFFLLVTIPYAHNRFNNLKELKKEEAQFNFRSGQLSQRLGEWELFIEKGKGFGYRNIYLYNPHTSQFVVARSGELKNRGGRLELVLKDGNLYYLDQNLTASFNRMKIYHSIKYQTISLLDLHRYWEENGKFIKTYLPVALLPLALLLFIPAISFYHPRLSSNRKPIVEGLGVLGVYLLLSQENRELVGAILIPISFFGVSIWIFRKRVAL